MNDERAITSLRRRFDDARRCSGAHVTTRNRWATALLLASSLVAASIARQARAQSPQSAGTRDSLPASQRRADRQSLDAVGSATATVTSPAQMSDTSDVHAAPDNAAPPEGDAGAGHADPIGVATREYAMSGVARTVREGSAVTYPYGHAQPTLTCAPLRACVIELEAGENVLSKIAGDTQRWEIEPAVAGIDGGTPLIVVKPHDCGLTTNLVLTTTRGRIYDLTLDSPPCPRGAASTHWPPNPDAPYTRHVRFYYPDDLVQSWAPITPAAESASTRPAAAPVSLAGLNFSYRIDREKGFPWTPTAIYDDGAHCYIKLPAAAAHLDAPVLFLLAPDGTKTLLNYALSGNTYITDRVFRRAVLVFGEGGHASELRLMNEHDATGAP